jgi:hypothetical protein
MAPAPSTLRISYKSNFQEMSLMRGTTRFTTIDFSIFRGATFAFICMAALAATAFSSKADDAMVDANTVARLSGAKIDPDHASPMELEYSVPGSVANTVAATKKL